MVRCARIIVLGLCAIYGVGGAMAQEGAAGGGRGPAAPAHRRRDTRTGKRKGHRGR